ncbi:RNA polymerase sigma-70 factor, sigma-E family [Amycolatopsis pretoriensis]|uniref:RNA polymerase sigma-70 factor, sigma-E family n=1 Tax=Amycolatopsis pretoriensis TaxID=218821 RepID=A0A1H5RDQ6_9PSEU|nr:SigE family RNA polymerase sigma factor [Amycolatopsis pretoriensis]SEF35748.1 RNA polymerase sigma-70 factor, sigma-E family [Amycolatopsis pretoriensis]
MRAGDEAGFREFARERALPLRRTAFLLCGDWHLAEDLVQVALIKLYRVWPKVARTGPVDNYARQVLLRCWLDERRRPWRRNERRDGVVPEEPRPDDPADAGISGDLLRALAGVPPKQRAAVVLRYCADLPVAEVSKALRCSEGTVRSQAARGLEALRAELTRLEAAERSV